MKMTLLKLSTVALLIAACVAVQYLGSSTKRVSAKEPVNYLTVDGKDLPGATTLNKDSTSEYGEVAFDHKSHSFNKYSPDGKTDISCAECHHTDQPKADLKPPLLTSERTTLLTADELKKADSAPVKGCRTCHFQEGNIPENKEMPVAIYKTADGKEDRKELTNEVAYHTNCNVCHDSAAKLRPELKKKPGFATTNDCLICHKKN